MTNDSRREKFSIGLHPLYLEKYNILCANLSPSWQPYFGLRSIEDQNKLYAEGRSTLGEIVTDARGGESPHNYGCATDWALWDSNGKPIWMGAKDPRWKEYTDAIAKAGLYWGGDFSGHFQDIDHNELHLSVSWTRIYEILKKENYENAIAEIAHFLIT